MIFQFRNNQRSIEKANFIISNNFKRILDASEKLFWSETQSGENVNFSRDSPEPLIFESSFKNEIQEITESRYNKFHKNS